MAHMDFREYMQTLAPPFLQEANGAAWSQAVGDLQDELIERCKAAVKSRFLQLGMPIEVLELIGSERGIERAPGDTDATYISRLVNAWSTWAWCGTAYGVLKALWDIGYTTPLIEIVGGLEYKLDANGELVIASLPPGSWTVDALPTFWSAFQVIFPEGSFLSVPAESSDTAQLIVKIVSKWKPKFSTCKGIVVIEAGRLIGYPHTKLGSGGRVLGGGIKHVWSVA